MSSHLSGVAKTALVGIKTKRKKGLTFTIMIVGASGMGKSTFVNTLCENQVFAKQDFGNAEKAALPKTVRISPVSVDLEEDGVKLNLTVIDTPGFGDNINNEPAFQDILGYIEKQYDDVLAEECRIKRNPKFQDNRVHALLYFLPPSGHSLREIDIEFMKKLGPRTNIIPVIAKSDSLTPQEIASFKKRIIEDIGYYQIPIYNFPVDEEEDDDELIEDNDELRALLPFSIIGSEEEIIMNGRRVRCRQYPWGVVEVDNSRHCDFSKLRYMLLSSHLHELKEITHDILYEQYRTQRLSRGLEITENERAAEDDLSNATSPEVSEPTSPIMSGNGDLPRFSYCSIIGYLSFQHLRTPAPQQATIPTITAATYDHIISDDWFDFRHLLLTTTLLDQVKNVSIITTPSYNLAVFTVSQQFQKTVQINKSRGIIDEYPEISKLAFSNSVVIPLKTNTVISFATQWTDMALGNSSTIAIYSTKQATTASKLLTKVIAIILVLIFLIRKQIFTAIVFAIENPKLFFPNSHEDLLKLDEFAQKSNLAFRKYLSSNKKLVGALGNHVIDNIIFIVIAYYILDSSLQNVVGVNAIENSNHHVTTSFLEFQSQIIPNATLKRVVIDIDDFNVNVDLKWRDSPSLEPLKHFTFPFLNAAAIEAKLENLASSLPVHSRFVWSTKHAASSTSSFMYGIPMEILLYGFMAVIFLKANRGMIPGMSSDFLNIETNIKERFADVAGLDEAKLEIMELVSMLKNPEKYTDMGAVIPRGLLMSGPSGTGKTLLAKAIAGESNCAFLSLSGSSFDEVFVGVGSSRVRKLFKEARQNSPCIIFIDEIDALGSRGKRASDATDSTLNQLLVEMDGFPSAKGREEIVVVVAATNRPQLVDEALKRPGRFDRHVGVALPDRNGRRDIFTVHLQSVKLDSFDDAIKAIEDKGDNLITEHLEKPAEDSGKLDEDSKLVEDLKLVEDSEKLAETVILNDVISKETIKSVAPLDSSIKAAKSALTMKYSDTLSKMTTGFSGADIKNICNEASILACRNEAHSVTISHFDQAIERVIAGLAKSKNTISPREKRVLAHHEAGHAVVAYFLKHSDPLVKVSIVPRAGLAESGGQTLGFAQYSPQDKYIYTKEQYMDKICVLLGGRTSELSFFGEFTSGAQDDLVKVTRLAYMQVQSLGFSEAIGWLSFGERDGPKVSDSTASVMDFEARAIVESAMKRTLELVTRYRQEISKVAEFLLEREVLLASDLIEMLGPRPFIDEIDHDK